MSARRSGSVVYSVRFPRLYRPTWAEIDLKRLKRNLKKIKSRVRGAEVLFVVKADAYGHGAVEAARAARASGAASWLGVSSVEEGAVLREAGVKGPILILGSLYPFESTLAAIRYGLTPTVASLESARRIVRAAAHPSVSRKRRFDCHVKIDTGMGRVGVRWPAGRMVVDYLARSRGVRMGGIYTHLSCAESDRAFTRAQLREFRGVIEELEAAGQRFRYRHAVHSAGLKYPEGYWDLVRPGLAAYGLMPGYEPALSLKSKIVFLKNVRKGSPVSYGALYRAPSNRKIATLPIGYGDGIPRVLSTLPAKGKPSALVRGRKCPIVGAITMDMLMVDVTSVPGVKVGDEAVIIGRSGALEIRAADLAAAARTISYEIVTGLKARVPRVYVR